MRLNFDAAAAGIADGGQPRDEAPAQPGTTLDALYRTHAGRLLRRFVRRAGVQHAEDLVQETFVRLASAQAERGVAPASPERYLSRVATNLMIDETKSARERTAHLAIPHEDAELVAPDQLATLEARDMLNRVESALLDLKPLTREIFIAAKFHGLSAAEISERTGLTVKSIEKHMSNAYAHLHRVLGQR